MRFELQPQDMSPTISPSIGLVAPFDFALDDECWRWLPENVNLLVTRTPRVEHQTVTIELAQDVSDASIVAPAVDALLAPGPGVIGYACTSGSFVGGIEGERELQQVMLDAGAPKAVTTSGALLMALEHLGIQKLAIATPYNQSLTDLLTSYISQSGREVVSSGYLDTEQGIARITYDAVKRMAREVDHPDAQAIFFSCTNLRTFGVIEELERELGKPILSANQVTMWALLRMSGIQLESNQRLFL